MSKEIKTWPPPVDTSKNEAWWNSFWAAETGFGTPADSFMKLIPVPENSTGPDQKRAVDIASGNGRYAVILAKMGYQTSAVELTASGIERIKQRCEEAQIKVDCKKMDFLKDTLDVPPFDVVVSSGLLEEIPIATHPLALENYVNYCLPGGKIILRYCIEIKGRGVLVEPGFVGKTLESMGCTIEYYKELDKMKTSRAGFQLKHGTIVLTKNK